VKSYQLLSLFIVSFVSTYTMETDLSRRSSMKQASSESQLVSSLRHNKDNFENQLKLDKSVELQTSILPTTLQFFSFGYLDPMRFLQYCYYQKFHNNEFINLDAICADAFSLKEYHEVDIDGYSALGAAMISKEQPIKERRIFIQELMEHGFKPTTKDIGLAELILYDEILAKEQKEKLKNKYIHLLHPDSPVFWFLLPQDVRRQIVQCFILLLKKDLWLLPEF
jgi:hypothetical protein